MDEYRRYQFNKVSEAALLDELIAAGFDASKVRVESDDTHTWVTARPEDYDRIAGIVGAHDAQTYRDRDATRESRWQQDKQILRQWYLDPTTPARQKALLRVLRRLYGEVADD